MQTSHTTCSRQFSTISVLECADLLQHLFEIAQICRDLSFQQPRFPQQAVVFSKQALINQPYTKLKDREYWTPLQINANVVCDCLMWK